MALPFPYPLTAGQKVTAELFNSLIAAIQDGSIFTSVSFVGDLVTALNTRMATLEGRVDVLELGHSYVFARNQYTLAVGQQTVLLDQVPRLDSEQLFLNGQALAKDNIPVGLSADYTLSGRTVTFTHDLSLQIIEGDRLVVTYAYEV
jgi:hypothetical protein